MTALEEFCIHTNLSVNSSRTKIMLLKSSLEFPSNYTWIENDANCLKAGKRTYYAYEKHAITERLSVWSSRNICSTLS